MADGAARDVGNVQATQKITVLVNDLRLEASIGAYEYERRQRQPIRLTVRLSTIVPQLLGDRLDQVVCYHDLSRRIEALANEDHFNLVETLAQQIAQLCLEDDRVDHVFVRVEKLQALSNASSVGVEIERTRPATISR